MRTRQAMILGGWLAGCGVEPEEGPTQAPPPPSLEVGAVLPGQLVTVTLAGLPSGTTAWLARGTTVGAGACPPLLAGNCLDIADASLVGSAVADGAGVATWTWRMALATPTGSDTVWQAAAVVGGAPVLSPPVIEPVSHPDDLCDPSGGGGWTANNATLECELLGLINATRAMGYTCPGSAGYQPPTHPLTMNAALREAARVHTEWMIATGTFSHASPGGPLGDTLNERVDAVGYGRTRRVSETIGRGQPTATGIMLDWLASRNHCADLMSRRVRDVGIGTAAGAGPRHWTAVQAEPF